MRPTLEREPHLEHWPPCALQGPAHLKQLKVPRAGERATFRQRATLHLGSSCIRSIECARR
eukprot:7804325-Pyramimonas_sp.AAC.2